MDIGDRLDDGRYVLTERVAVGGMAEIFKADAYWSNGWKTWPRIIKVLLPAFCGDPALEEAFFDEAHLLHQIHCESIIKCEFGTMERGRCYMVLEEIDGLDLSKLIARMQAARRPMPIAAWWRVMWNLCFALMLLRNAMVDGRRIRIVHRDVTPHNILLGRDGTSKLADFGVACSKARTYQTVGHVLKGKFGYMAPEQIRCEPLDERADLFAAGIVAYEMLTGTKPWPAEVNQWDYVAAVEAGRRRSIRQRRPEVPEEIEAFVDRLLVGDRDRRTQTANDALDFLAAYGQTIAGDPRKELGRLVEEFADPVGMRGGVMREAAEATANMGVQRKT